MSPTQIRFHKFKQTQEPWEMRALKLQLLHPSQFHDVSRLLMSNDTQRKYTTGYFSGMRQTGILDQIEFGEFTVWQMQLLIKACRAHIKSMRRQEQARVRQQATEGAANAQSS